MAGPWIAWAILRTFTLDNGYPLVPLMAFTPYAALASSLPVLVAALLRMWVVAGFALMAPLALVVAVLPRAIADAEPKGTQGGRVMTVMSVNLDDGNADPGEIMRLVREHSVDVLSLQELKAALMGLDPAGARRRFTRRALAPRSRAGGSALLGTAELGLRGIRAEKTADQPRAAIKSSTQASITLEAVHLQPPVTAADELIWRNALDALPSTANGEELRILAGDFNGTLDQAEIRELLDRGYVDAADAAGAGLRPTWPSTQERPPITIDHIMVDRRIGVRRFSTHAIRGTDHRAIVAELVLPR